MDNKTLHFLYVITIGVLLFFAMIVYANHAETIEKNRALSEAVKFALDKGIEPLAVTCAYEMKKDPSSLCVVYVSRISDDISVQVTKK